MDPRVTGRNLTMASSNENVLMAKSVNMAVQTPRKLPFQDATNNKGNELLKSAIKATGSASRVDKVQKQEPTLPQQQESIDLGFDFSEFVPPADGDCYCCNGNTLKLDEENWRKALAYADNFIANCLPDRLDQDFNEPFPPSPIVERITLTEDRWVEIEPVVLEPFLDFDVPLPPLPPIEGIPPTEDRWMDPKPVVLEPFIDFESSINGISKINLDDTASSGPLEVPDLDDDLESSLQMPDYCFEDESIIQDW